MESILTGICIFLFCICGLAGIGVLIIQYQLSSYLKKHHRAKWEYITSVGKIFGPGGRNSFRALDFLMSPDTLDDPIVEKLKKRTRYAILVLIVLWGAFPVLVIAIGFAYHILKNFLNGGSV